MDFKNIQLPDDMIETLEAIYKKARRVNPELTESLFLQRIIDRWLESYRRKKRGTTIKKNQCVLKNRIKDAVKLNRTTIKEIATETGINRTYLGEVAAGHSEPTITVAMLIAGALNENLTDLFFLEPADRNT